MLDIIGDSLLDEICALLSILAHPVFVQLIISFDTVLQFSVSRCHNGFDKIMGLTVPLALKSLLLIASS